MGKGKPRWYPEKDLNRIGNVCEWSEDDQKGGIRCEAGYGDINICKGDRHNCCKVKYHILASKKWR